MTALTLTLQAPAAPATLPARPPVDIRAHEAVLDVVVPVYNEETDLPRCVRRLHAHLSAGLPLLLPDHGRRQRQHGPHLAVAQELARELPCVRVRAPGPEGPRPRAGRRLVGLRRPGARLHGRRPVDRPRRAAPAGRPADLLCWPSARACGSTRCPSTGSTTPTAASTSSPPRSPTSRASPACSAGWPAAGSRSPRSAPGSGGLRSRHGLEAGPGTSGATVGSEGMPGLSPLTQTGTPSP